MLFRSTIGKSLKYASSYELKKAIKRMGYSLEGLKVVQTPDGFHNRPSLRKPNSFSVRRNLRESNLFIIESYQISSSLSSKIISKNKRRSFQSFGESVIHRMKTYNVKLKFKSPEDKQKLLDAMIIHNDIWNYISNVVFTHDKIEKKKPLTERQLHDLTYHKIRQLFPSAPSQLVIRARADVASTYQAIRSQERKAEKDRIKKQKQILTIIPVPEPTKAVRKQLAIRLDKRLFTYKGDRKSVV